MDSNVSKNTFYYKFLKLGLNREYLAIKKLLKRHILNSIRVYASNSQLNIDFEFIDSLIINKLILCDFSKISPFEIVYRCAIVFPLANYWHIPPLNLAQILREFLLTKHVISKTSTTLVFKVQIVSPGWIDFYLSDNALAVWLEEVVSWVSLEQRGRGAERRRSREAEEQEDLFGVQYAYARCCSLLRLGHQEKLIKIKHEYLGWEIIEPLAIDWLDDRGHCLLVHPTEKHLLIQLLMVVDELMTNSQKVSWQKLAHNLSKVFLEFWADCRIYGEVQQKTPALAQARLGLVALVQYFLAKILRDKLVISPMTEL